MRRAPGRPTTSTFSTLLLMESSLSTTSGLITNVNVLACEMFGYSERELIGETIEVLLPERFHERHEVHRKQYTAQPSRRPMGLSLSLFGRRKNGERIPGRHQPQSPADHLGRAPCDRVRSRRNRTTADGGGAARHRGRLPPARGRRGRPRDLHARSLGPGRHVEPRRRAHQGVARRRDPRPPLLGVLPPRRHRLGPARARPGTGRRRRPRRRATDGACARGGQRFWAETTLSAVRDDTGTLRGFAKVTRDRTESHQARARLESVVELNRAVLERRPEEDLLALVASRARAMVNASLVRSLVGQRRHRRSHCRLRRRRRRGDDLRHRSRARLAHRCRGPHRNGPSS